MRIDHRLWSTPKAKSQAILSLRRHGYQPLPLKRVYIPKANGKTRLLGIPTMKDRAMQALYLLALEPVAETTADQQSFGFRAHRSTADAIGQCFIALARKNSPQWILEGDIKGCFDNIDHDWLLKHIPTDRNILKMLRNASDTPIQRHRPLKLEANPFDPQWDKYFEERTALKIQFSLRNKKTLNRLELDRSHVHGIEVVKPARSDGL